MKTCGARAPNAGLLEDPWVEPPADVYTWTKAPSEAPDKPQYVEIGFEKGIPVSLDGKEMDGIPLIQKMNEIAGKHGIGRIDHIENRVVGIKSREIYEAPAAIVLIQAHQALEDMVMSKDQLRFKQKVSVEISDLIYNGFLVLAAQPRPRGLCFKLPALCHRHGKNKAVQGHCNGGRPKIAVVALQSLPGHL